MTSNQVKLEHGKTQKMETRLLMGNRAVVQGLLEAKVGLTSAYPGTPSTEIQMQLYKLHQKGQLYFEFSVNEKVALEVAAAAAMSGVRSAVIMKHVGVNVASDPLMAMAYFGVVGGMILVVVDDPGCLSSQNEQDSRSWGKFSHLPVLEPSTSQEVKDSVVMAFEISERYNSVVIIRLTNFTALNTSKVDMTIVEEKLSKDGDFFKDVRYRIPARYVYHKELHTKLKAIKEDQEFLEFNALIYPDSDSKKLIITQGAIFPMVEYARNLCGLEVPILKIGAIHPLSDNQLCTILQNYDYIYFVEELETYLEDEISAIIGRNNLNKMIIGKEKLRIPQENKITPDILLDAFNLVAADPEDKKTFKHEEVPQLPFEQVIGRETLLLPRTLPRLCDGCSHRGAFYSIKSAMKIDTNILPTDIGCYALGQVSPIEVGDYWLCMGGSIGTAIGMSLTNAKPVVAIIGDGTFFHSGIPPLIDAVMYDHNITVAILNNRLTAMTGGQPAPSSDKKIAKGQNQMDIEAIVKAIGVKWVKSVRVENTKENTKLMKEAMAHQGPSVLIFNGDCIVELYRHNNDLGKAPYIDQDACTYCGRCFIEFDCPSIVKINGKLEIKEDNCSACNICVSVCPQDAIIPRKR